MALKRSSALPTARRGGKTRVILAALSAVATGCVIAGPAAAVPGSTAATSPTAATTSIGALPIGAAPRNLAYGIGKRVFLNGRAFDLSPYWSAISPAGVTDVPTPEFTDIDLTRGVVLWSFVYFPTDVWGRVGSYLPGTRPKVIANEFSTGVMAATSGGFVTLNSALLYGARSKYWNYSGKLTPPDFSTSNPSFTEPTTIVGSAGASIVHNVPDGPNGVATTMRSWIQTPTHAAQKLPLDNTYAAGRGWLATRNALYGTCYRTAAVATPSTLRASVCSQTFPKVSDDGTKVAVVQARHVRLYNTATGAQINATNAPTLPAWDSGHFYSPLQWEDATHYLVSARDGNNLSILRCSTTGACERAVTSTIRAGVSKIVT